MFDTEIGIGTLGQQMPDLCHIAVLDRLHERLVKVLLLGRSTMLGG